MEFWEDNKRVILGCGAALLVLLALYLFFLGPMWRKVKSLGEENEKLGKQVGKYYPEGGVTVGNLKGVFELSNAKLRERYEDLVGKMEQTLKPPFVVPEGEPQPGLYFRMKLSEKQYEMLFYVSTRGMDSIDRSLGFGENVPPDEAVPELLNQLASACEIVRAAADAGVKTVSSITHKGVTKRGAPGYGEFLEEHGMALTMRCTLKSLITFVHSMDKRKYFFGLKELALESPLGEENDLLAVRLECATFRFREPAEPIKKKPEKPAGPRRIRAGTYGL